MAQIAAFSDNVLPYPVYGLPYTLILMIIGGDGNPLTGAAGLDSEISVNGEAPADCTNEATELGTSGLYYLRLTAAEMTCAIAAGVTKTTTAGAKTTPWTLYPRVIPVQHNGTAAAGSANTITLGATALTLPQNYRGELIYIRAGTGLDQARMITGYTSGKVATVTPNWATNPAAASEYEIYPTDVQAIVAANVMGWYASAVAAPTTEGYPLVMPKTGSIANASFAADVGSTAYATNVIALAADKAILNYDAPTKAEMDTAHALLATVAKQDVIDGIVDSILADTADLQMNQGNWLTATGFSTHSPGDVWGVVTRVLTANTNLNDPTAATIADAVWDELSTGHTEAGKAGQQMWTDVDAILVDTGTTLDAALAVVDANVDAILIDTGTTLDAALAVVDANVDAILVDTGTTLDAALAVVDANIDWLVSVSEGDVKIIGTDPMRLVVYTKGTSTPLITKYLYEIGGTSITEETQVVGQQLETAL